MKGLKKSLIGLIIFAAITGALALWSIPAQVNRINEEIQNLGTVTYTSDCKQKLDSAVEHYNSLDAQLNLKAQVKDEWKLDSAKIEYCRLAIKDASVAEARQTIDGLTTMDVQNKVSAAREVVDKYLSSSQCASVENYSTLTDLESKYSASSGGNSEAVDIPMC